MKIRVGLPSYDGNLTPLTKRTIDDLVNCKDIIFEVMRVDNGSTYRGRNIAALCPPLDGGAPKKNKFDYDYYFCMDSDMSFCVDNVKRLIAKDKDIISGAYPMRSGKNDLLVAGYFEGVEGNASPNKWLRIYDYGLKEVDWAGCGCLLIKKNVLETMEFPYFRHNIIEYQNKTDVISEDLSFCVDARKAGFKIWCDLDNRFAHIAH